MPDCFQHLKYKAKRHLTSDSHRENSKVCEDKKLDEELNHKEGKINALNCASAAYFNQKLNTSYQSHESIIIS